MNNTKTHLSFENRLKLNKEAGSLIHSFGEGYFIIDEYGKEVNNFVDENNFNRLIKKFKYRYLLIKKLNELHNRKFSFGEDNTLILEGKTIEQYYWNLPKNKTEVDFYLKTILDKFIPTINSK